MIILETKMSTEIIREILSKGNTRYEIMAQDAIGSVGGLAIIWNMEEIQFENWISLPWILSGTFKAIGTMEYAVLTGVYGPHTPTK